jgi:hypothetical protein
MGHTLVNWEAAGAAIKRSVFPCTFYTLIEKCIHRGAATAPFRGHRNAGGPATGVTPPRGIPVGSFLLLSLRNANLRCAFNAPPSPYHSLRKKLANQRRKLMIRLIAFAFAIALTTSAQAMPVAPVHEPDGMITEVAYGCGPFRTRVAGVCVARTTVRQARRHYRRCARWHGGGCVRYY